MTKKLTALIILDGFGYTDKTYGNAIRADGAANITALMEKYPHTLVAASGLSVGLPDGQMGNSEVGHLNIGAGRVVYQDLTRISKAIDDGDFFTNPALTGAVKNCLDNGTSLHLMGLCSNGGVHSHLTHLYALVKLAHDMGLERVFLHCFTDGRDTPQDSGKGYIHEISSELSRIGCGRIATVIGRYYAMDRDNRFERLEKAYDALVYGEGAQFTDPEAAVQASYDAGLSDEFMLPAVMTENGAPVATIKPNDSVVFFDFRPDRARELTRALMMDDFTGFARRYGRFPLYYVCMTQYDAAFGSVVHVAFGPETIANTLGEYVSSLGMKQIRVAETEKYAHVTFFFNGGVEAPVPGEDRALIPSPKVATYDLKPEMSAYEITDEALRRIDSGKYDLMVLNFANTDMVGHTGVMDAAVKAVHTVDICAAKLISAILARGGNAIVTADHGNCECMMYDNGEPMTTNTTNPVPLILVDDARRNVKLRDGGRLCDIAPTLLELMGLPVPPEMTGKSLII